MKGKNLIHIMLRHLVDASCDESIAQSSKIKARFQRKITEKKSALILSKIERFNQLNNLQKCYYHYCESLIIIYSLSDI